MISVALCTYNGADFIQQQLDSIFTQTVPVDEVVICDDCSMDSTFTILKTYAVKYPQIRLIKNEINLGFRANFEKALIECQGDYIFFSDQDDIWSKDKVENTVSFLKESGMYGVYTDGILINEDNQRLGESLFSRIKLRPYIEHHLLEQNEFEILCLNGNHVTGATLAITKSAKDLVLPFRTSKILLHDMWMALRLSSINKLGCLDKPLISYRLHTSQECGLSQDRISDLFYNCYLGQGDYRDLLDMRGRTIAPVYVCKLNFLARWRIFRTYKNLCVKCIRRHFQLSGIMKLLFVECVVAYQSIVGIEEQ